MSDATAVEKFDAGSFRERVEEKIKAEFMELLPDEMFRAMVQETIDRFTRPKPVKDYNGRVTRHDPSEFERIVLEVYEERLREAVKAELASEKWVGHWDNGRQQASEAVSDLIVEHSGEILAGMLGSAIQEVVQQLQYRT